MIQKSFTKLQLISIRIYFFILIFNHRFYIVFFLDNMSHPCLSGHNTDHRRTAYQSFSDENAILLKLIVCKVEPHAALKSLIKPHFLLYLFQENEYASSSKIFCKQKHCVIIL